MGFIDKLQSKKGKKFMGYLYGWGASIVIVGAMFKIQHWPGASAMLVGGLSIEAIIFFFSAFEPIHEHDDWGLVYPELRGEFAHSHDPEKYEKIDSEISIDARKVIEQHLHQWYLSDETVGLALFSERLSAEEEKREEEAGVGSIKAIERSCIVRMRIRDLREVSTEVSLKYRPTYLIYVARFPT